MNLDTGRPLEARFTLRLRGPADLLVAVPYLLGFHPRNSLVLVGTGPADDPRVECVLRIDLPPPELDACLAMGLAGSVSARRCDEVFVAVIGGPEPERGAGPPPGVAELAAECSRSGIRVRDVVWAAEVAEGAEWRCYGECGCAGTLPDPSCSPLAAAVVAAGQVTYGDRAELERAVAAPPEPVQRRRSRLLNERIDAAARAGEPVSPSGFEAVELVAGWVRTAAERRVSLVDQEVVELCLALSDPLVRDLAFGFALGPLADGAERLWSALVGQAPDPEAAEPAVLLAFSALVNGDGALMSVALERAGQAWPGHRLTEVFQSALEAGTDPDQLCHWFAEGAERAVELLSRRDEPR